MSRLQVFVYGTLKRGGRNFERYCREVVSIEHAAVRGRLFHLLEWNCPMLEIAPEAVLHQGSHNYQSDLSLQIESSQRLTRGEVEFSPPPGDWDVISGEILIFEETGPLAGLDQLEKFNPGGPSNYHRVLTVTANEPAIPIWVYIAAGPLPQPHERITLWTE